jgi:hypothetical protein
MIGLSGADAANRRAQSRSRCGAHRCSVAGLRVWRKTERETDRVHRVADWHNLENPKRHLCNHAELAYLCGKTARCVCAATVRIRAGSWIVRGRVCLCVSLCMHLRVRACTCVRVFVSDFGWHDARGMAIVLLRTRVGNSGRSAVCCNVSRNRGPLLTPFGMTGMPFWSRRQAMAAVADRGAALELQRCPQEQPSVEEPVLVCIGRRCDLHHMRCTTRRSDCNIRHRHARSGHAACGVLTCSRRRGARGVRRTAREVQPAATHAMKQRKAYSNVNHVLHNTSLAHDDTPHEPCGVQQCQACSRRQNT